MKNQGGKSKKQAQNSKFSQKHANMPSAVNWNSRSAI